MTKPDYKLNPFLHTGVNGHYNPLNDHAVAKGTPEFDLLNEIEQIQGDVAQAEVFQNLVERQFIVPADADLSQQYLLKYVSIETHTVCNHKCYFCPVSVHTRARRFMHFALFENIARQLAQEFAGIDGVFLNGYNEPTIDPDFVRQVTLLNELGIKVAVNSNGSGLPPETVDALLTSGGLEYLCINLSTLDQQQFIADRKADHLSSILRNLDYLADRNLANENHIVVLGQDDEAHDKAYSDIRRRFENTPFSIRRYKVNSRSGRINVYQQAEKPHRILKGCEQTGSRPLQHLHINAYGQCILCCQDYHDEYTVGDLTKQSIAAVLGGPEMAQYRRWAYGIEEAPEDFICRKCSFAITD